MIYNVKLRCTGGKANAQSVTYSTFAVEAADEAEATRLATIKAKQRYFGDNPQVRAITVTPVPRVVLNRSSKRKEASI